MALIAHQPQGLYVTYSSRHLPWTKGLKLKQCLTNHHLIGRADWHYILKRNISLSVGPSHTCGSKLKPLRIAAFKGSAQNDDSVSRANGLKVSKSSFRLEENGEIKSESPKADVPLSCASEVNESLAASSGINKLFKKWLTMLRTPPSNQEVEDILGELPPPGVLPETPQGIQRTEKTHILKVAWSKFLALDATIKIPFLIFAPLFVAVNVTYGAEVSKELTPLWVLGPLIVALYMMILRWLVALYVFTFKQTVKVVKNSPSYCILAFSYVFYGKLKEDIEVHFLQPILRIKNTDYKELARKKLEELAEWIREKYLDYVESIWPYYCRAIRFLKRANLI